MCRLERHGEIQLKLIAKTEGRHKLGLRELLQRYVDNQWSADHYTDEQRCEILLDQFKRAMAAELEMLDVICSVD